MQRLPSFVGFRIVTDNNVSAHTNEHSVVRYPSSSYLLGFFLRFVSGHTKEHASLWYHSFIVLVLVSFKLLDRSIPKSILTSGTLLVRAPPS